LLTYTHPHFLIVDEVGYLTYGPDAANVLLHVVNNRHLRKRPMIFTTNKPFSEWGKVLRDDDLAAAILDRILERERLIHLNGANRRATQSSFSDLLLFESDAEPRVPIGDVEEVSNCVAAMQHGHDGSQAGSLARLG
jgi:hypothetical protein